MSAAISGKTRYIGRYLWAKLRPQLHYFGFEISYRLSGLVWVLTRPKIQLGPNKRLIVISGRKKKKEKRREKNRGARACLLRWPRRRLDGPVLSTLWHRRPRQLRRRLSTLHSFDDEASTASGDLNSPLSTPIGDLGSFDDVSTTWSHNSSLVSLFTSKKFWFDSSAFDLGERPCSIECFQRSTSGF